MITEYEKRHYVVMVRKTDTGLPLVYDSVVSREAADELAMSLVRSGWEHVWIAAIAMEYHK